MDDSSESSFSSSYQEEYWLLKKQYDEVLESNSQMVLRLEEAKMMLFKNTRELQSQNSALMSENMNMRAQKEYLQQGLGKLGSLVGNLMEEMDTQKGSMERQTGYLYKLVCLVKSVAENKDNDLTNPETEAKTEEENGPFLNLTALREMDKHLRASTVGSYYLPAIEEEKCGHVDDDDDESFNATRRTRRSASSEQSHEAQQKSVQGNSKLKGSTVSRIGKRGSSIRTKEAVENEELPQDANKTGDILPSPEIIEGKRRQGAPDEGTEIIENTSDYDKEQNQAALTAAAAAAAIVRKRNNYMIASMGPSTSTMMERKDHESAQVLKEKIYNPRDDITKSEASNTISSNSENFDHQSLNIQKDYLKEANKDVPSVMAEGMDVLQETPDAIIMKNVATSYLVGGAQHKTSAEKYRGKRLGKSTSTESESMQTETKIQDKHVVEKTEKSVCRVELVNLFGPAQPNHRHEVNINPQNQTNAIALHTSMKALSPTRNGEVLNLVKGRDQSGREKPTNGSQSSAKVLTTQSNAPGMSKDAAKKTSPHYQDTQANDALESEEIQSSCQTTARVSDISRAREPKKPLNRRSETPSSENMGSKPKKTPDIQGDDSTTRSGKSQKFEECRDQQKREKPASDRQSSTNASTAQLSACCIPKNAVIKISPNCEDAIANADIRIQDPQISSEIKASEISQARKHNDLLNEPNNTPAETPCSGNKENKPRKTQNMNGDANATKNRTQQALLPLVRKSKYAKKDSSSHSNLLTPVWDPSAAKNASGSDVSLNLAITPDEDDSETRRISRETGTVGQSKPHFLSPSMEDVRVSTRRTLRESQMANSLLGEVRVSVASSQGDSCYSDFATPKKVKRVYLRKELASLLSVNAAFQGDLGSEETQEKRMTRARSKPRRDKEVNYNLSSTSETDETNGDFKFKPPGRRPRRGAKK